MLWLVVLELVELVDVELVLELVELTEVVVGGWVVLVEVLEVLVLE